MPVNYLTKGEVTTLMLSNKHRQKLSAWFLEKNFSQFFSQLKLQKFLFFYETFSKINGLDSDFSSLKAYKNGPVYSDVYGDFNYRKYDFISILDGMEYKDEIKEEIAIIANRIVSILNEEELSEFTHAFNMWKTHKEKIDQQILHIPMHESDFSIEDQTLAVELWNMYSDTYYENVEIFTVNTANFILEKGLKEKLSNDQQAVLSEIADQGLPNPIYVTLNEDGVLEID